MRLPWKTSPSVNSCLFTKRANKRPRLIRHDRWFWIAVASIWKDGDEHCCRSPRLGCALATPAVPWPLLGRTLEEVWEVSRPSTGNEIRELIQEVCQQITNRKIISLVSAGNRTGDWFSILRSLCP